MKQWFSANELAGLPGMVAQAKNLPRKAKRSGWESRERVGRGGGQEYFIGSLPPETKAALREAAGETLDMAGESTGCATQGEQWAVVANPQTGEAGSIPVPAQVSTDSTVSATAETPSDDSAIISAIAEKPAPEVVDRTPPSSNKSELRRQAKIEILAGINDWCRAQGIDQKVGCEVAYSAAYNARKLNFPDWMYEAVGTVSRASLHNWRKLAGQDLHGLAGKYGNRKNSGIIHRDPTLKTAIDQALVYLGPAASATPVLQIIDGYGRSFSKPSYHQVRRYIHRLQTERRAEWLQLTNPKAERNTVNAAFGTRSRGLVPNQIWEIDFTKNDLLLNWGGERKRFSCGFAIDLATRRMRILVSPTPRGSATAALVLKCAEEWGKPQVLRPDCGKEFINKMIRQFAAVLEICLDPCYPGHPEGKGTVERTIGSFNRSLKPLPSFVGANVEARQAIRSHKGEDQLTDLAMDFEEFQEWADIWCQARDNRFHKSLGCSPNEKLAQYIETGWEPTWIDASKEVMGQLCSPSKVCTVQRQGINWNGRRYVAAELAAVIQTGQVLCFAHPSTPNHIKVYTEDLSEFICDATWENQLSNEELAEIAARARNIQAGLKEGQAALRKGAKKLSNAIAKNPEKLLAPGAAAQLLGDLGQQFSNDAIEAMTTASRVVSLPPPPSPTPEEQAETAALMAELTKPAPPSDEELRQRYYGLYWDVSEGKTLSPEDQDWMDYMNRTSMGRAWEFCLNEQVKDGWNRHGPIRSAAG